LSATKKSNEKSSKLNLIQNHTRNLTLSKDVRIKLS